MGGYSQCLHMCKLYYIRKRKRTTCTYAAAGPEQLLQIKKHLPASPKNVRIPVKQNIFLQVRVNAALFLFWFIFQNISFQISCFESHKFKKQETVLYKVKLLCARKMPGIQGHFHSAAQRAFALSCFKLWGIYSCDIQPSE